MASDKDSPPPKESPKTSDVTAHRGEPDEEAVVGAIEEQKYAFSDKRKLGVTGAVFLILNKMIGTGSMYHPDHLACSSFTVLSRVLLLAAQ